MKLIVALKKAEGSMAFRMPLTCCVFPVPEGPASITGLCFLTKSVIQNATEQVSDVGTVMADMFIVLGS